MQLLATLLFLATGVINLVPGIGVVSAGQLQSLYGIPIDGPDLEIAMRHRAILLGIVGALLVAAAFQPPLRNAAAIAGFVSMASFVAIAWWVGDANAELRRVAAVDCAAIVALGVGVALHATAGSR